MVYGVQGAERRARPYVKKKVHADLDPRDSLCNGDLKLSTPYNPGTPCAVAPSKSSQAQISNRLDETFVLDANNENFHLCNTMFWHETDCSIRLIIKLSSTPCRRDMLSRHNVLTVPFNFASESDNVANSTTQNTRNTTSESRKHIGIN